VGLLGEGASREGAKGLVGEGGVGRMVESKTCRGVGF
jgi:hypothetical protein